ncbi:MAG: sodium-dependent transporter, partial [Prevotella sp.]|nr:sodium-dependent transporter [Prevotella sp.]
MTKRTTFGSRIGAILAAAGSAVGLGNIWRFPSETGQNGGAAFIIVYIACIVLVAVPVLIAELSMGREARANVFDTFRKLCYASPAGRVGIMV